MRISDWSSDVCSSDLPKVTSTDEWIEVAWQSRSTRPPAFYPRMIPNLPELVDLTLRVRWFAASAMRLDAEVRHEGKEGDDCHRGTAAHIFTPESEDSTHYFYAMTRNYAADDEDVNQLIAETRAHIFQIEEKPMIERERKSVVEGKRVTGREDLGG